MRHYLGSEYEVFSAGTIKTHVNETAKEVMSEIGYCMAGHHSKSIEEIHFLNFDYIITVCNSAKESCPVLPKASKIYHWPFKDPASFFSNKKEDVLAEFRTVRDQIKRKILSHFHSKQHYSQVL